MPVGSICSILPLYADNLFCGPKAQKQGNPQWWKVFQLAIYNSYLTCDVIQSYMTKWPTCRLPGRFLSPPLAEDSPVKLIPPGVCHKPNGELDCACCTTEYIKFWQQLLLIGWKKATAQWPLALVAVLALFVLWKALNLCILKDARQLLRIGLYGYYGCWAWIMQNICMAFTKSAGGFNFKYIFMYLEFDLLVWHLIPR